MNAPPPIDAGDAPRLARLWEMVVTPSAGRLGNTLRVTAVVLSVVLIAETFQIPEVALSAYVVLFVSRAEAGSTLMGAAIAGIAVILAILLTIVAFMASLSEPALRVTLIAGLTFCAMFLSRTCGALGPAFFAAGFIMAYGLTLGDETLGLALQPGGAANTSQFTLPELAFFPPEEALLHFLLWLCLAVALPIALVIVANLLTGRDPAVIVRAEIEKRLLAAAAFCEAVPGADRRLATLAGAGVADLKKLDHLAGLLHRAGQRPAPLAALQRLLLLLPATRRVAGADEWREQAASIGAFCRDRAAGRTPAVPEPVFTGNAAPLGPELAGTLHKLGAPPYQNISPESEPVHAAAKQKKRLLSTDAFTNPDHARFALKVTLAVLFCYALQNGLDWPGIHTCVITCFFVSLTTVGETVHKASLRLTGCLIGGALGIGAILAAMPVMMDIGDLLLLLVPVTFVAAWIGFGSDRIAYAGWQIALAFYLSTLQGFGPTLDMETARDRIVGIMLGNAAVFVIFTTVWPVSVARIARTRLARALDCLAALQGPAEEGSLQGFAEAMAQARGAMINEPFETRAVLDADGRRAIDAGLLAQVQALAVPATVMADIRRNPAWQNAPEETRQAADADQAALGDWFSRAAAWVRTGEGAADVLEGPPGPRDGPASGLEATLAVWHRILAQDVNSILDQVRGGAAPRNTARAREVSLAAG